MGADGGRDPEGLEVFCRREYPRLVRLLAVYCGDGTAAEDLAQETLARVWEHWERVGGMDRPDLWAKRVALNLANSWHRRRRFQRRAVPAAVAAGDETARVDGDAEFARLVRGLSARQRAVVVLRYYEDLSVSDTAGLLGVREGTVRALSSQALTRLRAEGVVEEVGR